jgi:hypothetical protein
MQHTQFNLSSPFRFWQCAELFMTQKVELTLKNILSLHSPHTSLSSPPLHQHTHAQAYMHIHHMHVHIYIYMHIHIHTCTHIHTHTHSHTHCTIVAGKTQFSNNCIFVTFVHSEAQGDPSRSPHSALWGLWRSRRQYSQQIPTSSSRTIKLPAAPPLSLRSWHQYLKSAQISITFAVVIFPGQPQSPNSTPTGETAQWNGSALNPSCSTAHTGRENAMSLHVALRSLGEHGSSEQSWRSHLLLKAGSRGYRGKNKSSTTGFNFALQFALASLCVRCSWWRIRGLRKTCHEHIMPVASSVWPILSAESQMQIILIK